MVDDTVLLVALEPLRHDGRPVAPGDALEVGALGAAALVRAGAAREATDDEVAQYVAEAKEAARLAAEAEEAARLAAEADEADEAGGAAGAAIPASRRRRRAGG